MRGWRVPTILDVVGKGMTPLQLDVAHGRTAEVRARAAAAAQALVSGGGDARAREFSDALAERSKPYRASLLHLAVFSGELSLLKVCTLRARRTLCCTSAALLRSPPRPPAAPSAPSALAAPCAPAAPSAPSAPSHPLHPPPPLQLLLELQSPHLSVSSLDCFDRSALSYCACKDEPAMALLLLQAACDPNLQDREGRTALHIGAAMGHVSTLGVLLDFGADPMLCAAPPCTSLHPLSTPSQPPHPPSSPPPPRQVRRAPQHVRALRRARGA